MMRVMDNKVSMMLPITDIIKQAMNVDTKKWSLRMNIRVTIFIHTGLIFVVHLYEALKNFVATL